MSEPTQSISTEVLTEMVSAVNDEWTLRDVDPLKDRGSMVYRLQITGETDTQAVILKATDNPARYTLESEARLLSLLDDRTDIPVPRIFGAIDTHDELPTPFFIMEALDGRMVLPWEAGELCEEIVEQIAFQVGQYLAELHALDIVDSFGGFGRTYSTPLTGPIPSSAYDEIAVEDPYPSWMALLREWAETTLERHSKTQFDGLVPKIRQFVTSAIDEVPGDVTPALGRVDNSYDNLLLNTNDGTVTAMVDWGGISAITPAYDLVTAEYGLTAGPWRFTSRVPDLQAIVRPALLNGYRTVGEEQPIERFQEHYTLYYMLSLIRPMNHVESRLNRDGHDHVEEAVNNYREYVSQLPTS